MNVPYQQSASDKYTLHTAQLCLMCADLNTIHSAVAHASYQAHQCCHTTYAQKLTMCCLCCRYGLHPSHSQVCSLLKLSQAVLLDNRRISVFSTLWTALYDSSSNHHHVCCEEAQLHYVTAGQSRPHSNSSQQIARPATACPVSSELTAALRTYLFASNTLQHK